MWCNHIIMGNIHFETLRLGKSEQQFSDCQCTEFVSRRKYYACSQQKHNIHCPCPTHVLEHSSRSEGWGCREDFLNNNRGAGFDPDWAVGRYPHLEPCGQPINPTLRECHSFNPVTKTLRGYEHFNPFKPGSSGGREPTANPQEGNVGLGTEWTPDFKSQQHDPLISQLPHDNLEIEPFGTGNDYGPVTPVLATTSGSASPIAVYRSGTTFFPVRQPSKTSSGIGTPNNGLIQSDNLNYGTSSPIATHAGVSHSPMGSSTPDLFAGRNGPSSGIPKEPAPGKHDSPVVNGGTKAPVSGSRQSFGIITPRNAHVPTASTESPHGETETQKPDGRTGPAEQLTTSGEPRPLAPHSHDHVQHESPYRKLSSHDGTGQYVPQAKQVSHGNGEDGRSPFPEKHTDVERTNQISPHANASSGGHGNSSIPNQNSPSQGNAQPLVSSGPQQRVFQDEFDRNDGARANTDSDKTTMFTVPRENEGTYSPVTGNSANLQHPQQLIPSEPSKPESPSNFPQSQVKQKKDSKDKPVARLGSDTVRKSEGPSVENSSGPRKTRSRNDINGHVAPKTTSTHDGISRPKSEISKAFLFDDFFEEPLTPSVSRRQLPAGSDTDERRPKRDTSQRTVEATLKKEDKRAAVPVNKSENGGSFLPKLVKTLSSMVKLRFDEEAAVPSAKEPTPDKEKGEQISRTDSTQALFQRPWKEERSNLDSGRASPIRTMVDERALSFYDMKVHASAVPQDRPNGSAAEVLRSAKPINKTLEDTSKEPLSLLIQVRKPVVDTSAIHPTAHPPGTNVEAYTRPAAQPVSSASDNYPGYAPAKSSTSDRSTPQKAKVVDTSRKPIPSPSSTAPQSSRTADAQDKSPGFPSVPSKAEASTWESGKHNVPLSAVKTFQQPGKDATAKPVNETKAGDTKNLLPPLATDQDQNAAPSFGAVGPHGRTTSGLAEVHKAVKLVPVAHDFSHTHTEFDPARNEDPKVHSEVGPDKQEGPKVHSEIGNARSEDPKVHLEMGTGGNEGRNVHPLGINAKSKGPNVDPATGIARNEGPNVDPESGIARNEGLKVHPETGIARNEGLKVQPVVGTARNESPNVRSGLVTEATVITYNSIPKKSHIPLPTDNRSGARTVPPHGNPSNLNSSAPGLTLKHQDATVDVPQANKVTTGSAPHTVQYASPERVESELTLHVRSIEEIKLVGPFVMPSSFPSATLMPEVHKSHQVVGRKENSDDGKRSRTPQVSERIQADMNDPNREEDFPVPALPGAFPRNDGTVTRDIPVSPADSVSGSRPASNVNLNPLQNIRTSFPPYYSHQKLYVPSPAAPKNRVSRTAGEAVPDYRVAHNLFPGVHSLYQK